MPALRAPSRSAKLDTKAAGRRRARYLDEQAYRRFDRVLTFIYVEMVSNAKGKRFGFWSSGFRYCPQQSLVCSQPVVTPETTANNGLVLAPFGLLVRPDGLWDHKSQIRSLLKGGRDLYTPVRGDDRRERIYYDIWSNIHYGYVGRSHGIPAPILRTGQLLAEGKNTAADDISIEVGISLWGDRRDSLRRSDIQRAVLQKMSAYRRASSLEDVVVRPGVR